MHTAPFWIALAACLAVGCKKPLFELSETRAESQAAPPPHNPKELGWVRWHRNFEEAKALSKSSGKPIFLLFQEVPGCGTCVGFGESVLSHPLVIEAIESEFVPVAIHNNKGGHDGEVLARFGEPSWNNPVVRFVDAAEKDLIARADGVWSTHGIATRMAQALAKAKRDTPTYLALAVEETSASERATFAMGCYWSGEACLGAIDGVVATKAAWLGGREVVVVDYDDSKITEAALKERARVQGCGELVARSVRVTDASDENRKYHLKRSRWRYVPLTPLQSSRVNAALGRGASPDRWVSPRQRALFGRISKADASSLEGLAAPPEVAQLVSYEHALRKRLGAH